MPPRIKRRERDAILQSLRAGVVPRQGLQHIQVGRKAEVDALLKDIEGTEQGGSAVRFVVGRFGAGKTFFLNLLCQVALKRSFVVAQADVTMTRRLHSTSGQARALYTELMHNLAVRSKPEGGALPAVVQRWVSDVDYQVRAEGGGDEEVRRAIHERLKPLQELVSGYDFAAVIAKYYDGFQSGNEVLMNAALRWLRAEYTTKTDARRDLGVRTIIDDSAFYEYLKLMAAFTRTAGYAGLLVNIDEMGVLSHRLSHVQARNANYEMILRIVNDCLQGGVSGVVFMFAGITEFFEDRRRGLASYEALATRLADNVFVADGMTDFAGPVIRLANLSAEDLYVLLRNIRNVFASYDESKYLVPDEALREFMNYCSRRLGAEFYQTPRDVVKSFVGLLSVLEQNPSADWRGLLGRGEDGGRAEAGPPPDTLAPDRRPRGEEPGDDLATFEL